MKLVNSYNTVMKDRKGIRLNGNEKFNNISEKSIEGALDIVKGCSFYRYPDSESTKLREAYGKIIGLKKEYIIAGNGSDEMISLVINATIKKGKKALTLDPDFSMYDFYVACNEGKLLKYKTEEDGKFSVRKFINYGEKFMPSLIIISNPNNPTGNLLTIDDIESILDSFSNTTVVIDEAYYEFAGVSAISLISKYKNLVITRTLSKAWGLAALRVGFLISNEDKITELNKFKAPYNLNSLSQNIACSVLNFPEKILKSIEEIVFERERLYKAFKLIEYINPINFTVYPSKANYIYGNSIYIKEIRSILEEKEIVIRYFDNNFFRITVGAPWENDIVINVINNILGNEGGKNAI